jgi:hypothetical protein
MSVMAQKGDEALSNASGSANFGQRPTALMCSAQVRTNDHKQENDNKAMSERMFDGRRMVQTSDKSTIAIPRVATFHSESAQEKYTRRIQGEVGNTSPKIATLNNGHIG